AAGASPDQPAMPGACPIVGQRMAGGAARVYRFPGVGVANWRRHGRDCPGGRERQSDQHLQGGIHLHDMNADGTGASHRAWRNTAQCMASSPRMLAAALARSRFPNNGTAPRYALTAPFSSSAAKRNTSSCDFSLSVGNEYLSFADMGLPPSWTMVF